MIQIEAIIFVNCLHVVALLLQDSYCLLLLIELPFMSLICSNKFIGIIWLGLVVVWVVTADHFQPRRRPIINLSL